MAWPLLHGIFYSMSEVPQACPGKKFTQVAPTATDYYMRSVLRPLLQKRSIKGCKRSLPHLLVVIENVVVH